MCLGSRRARRTRGPPCYCSRAQEQRRHLAAVDDGRRRGVRRAVRLAPCASLLALPPFFPPQQRLSRAVRFGSVRARGKACAPGGRLNHGAVIALLPMRPCVVSRPARVVSISVASTPGEEEGNRGRGSIACMGSRALPRRARPHPRRWPRPHLPLLQGTEATLCFFFRPALLFWLAGLPPPLGAAGYSRRARVGVTPASTTTPPPLPPGFASPLPWPAMACGSLPYQRSQRMSCRHQSRCGSQMGALIRAAGASYSPFARYAYACRKGGEAMESLEGSRSRCYVHGQRTPSSPARSVYIYTSAGRTTEGASPDLIRI